MSMELSERERGIIEMIRATVEAEVNVFVECLVEADKFRYELTSANRCLEAENIDLRRALNEHEIDVALPCTQYTGTP
jgi:hypothetical protein